MITHDKIQALETLEEAARRKARENFLAFILYTKKNYEVNWHHRLICKYLERFISGDIKRLMIFTPPQHGKEIADSQPIITTNGWTTHGQIKVNDYVFNDKGNPVKVLALSEKCLSEYNVYFSDGEIIQCHGNHEWQVYDRNSHKERILSTNQLVNLKLRNGIENKRGNRNIFQLKENVLISFTEKILPIQPYVMGAWLGDGTSTAWIHKTTGVHRTSFGSFNEFKKLNLYNKKRIPAIYLISSIQQRLELLAGLIDTDGYVYQKNGRITFTNINKELIEDVRKLVISLGFRCTICEYEPVLSTSGIQGKHKVYQLCFNPTLEIPTVLKRKKIYKTNFAIRKRGIERIEKSVNPEMGRCIQVEGGIYLVGNNLIPTHNSQLVSRSLPAYILGKDPERKIVLASYSGDLASSFNRDCQRIIDSEEYRELFPKIQLNSKNIVTVSGGYLRNSDVFQIVGHNGFLKTTGVGNALTGTTAELAIIDDPVKDTLEAQSATFQLRNWNWYNDVLFTRINNKTGILITQTRWDENDLSGLLIKSMKEGRGEEWVILNLPAIKEDYSNPEDPRQIGEALWESWHSLEKLNTIKKQNNRTFQSLYQQNPQPVETGGEFYKEFKIWRNVKAFDYDPLLPLHISFDFNVNPGMHALVFQIKVKECYQLAEFITISPKNNTKGCCQEFLKHYHWHKAGLFVYGDPSGRAQSTRDEAGFNDFKIILDELKQFRPELRVAYAHPAVKMRGMFINQIFESGFEGIKFWLHPNCPQTIKDFQFIKEDSDGTKLKEKMVDIKTGVNCEKYGHLSDAFDYMVCEAFKTEYNKFQRSGGLYIPNSVSQPRNKALSFNIG
jgi:hypothetical protein